MSAKVFQQHLGCNVTKFQLLSTCIEFSRNTCILEMIGIKQDCYSNGPGQANLVLIAYEVQASLRIRAVSPEPPLLAHTSSESRGTFRQKASSLAHLNGWACAVKI